MSDQKFDIECYLEHEPGNNRVLVKWAGYPESDATWRNIRGDSGIVKEISLESHLHYVHDLSLSLAVRNDVKEAGDSDGSIDTDDADDEKAMSDFDGVVQANDAETPIQTMLEQETPFSCLDLPPPTVLFPPGSPVFGSPAVSRAELLQSASDAADAATLSSQAAVTSAKASAASSQSAGRLLRMALDML